ncbi:AbrB/MazE/SpoVT family DNA-binding domain-containing protein [Halogeometricum borinquense]|uniref:AbrB/MazE/SpoVT family DNA-binding domain-containing protein n=2 Tax=Halogeometricum borinquense TaxID=60847 RepID=A0A6C0UM70_9EURY|nr:AbrB/MazE/SpoVT family DNA-binding domain-containing protein [Halogeometricum borinquense]QIQ77811.1 AbrB/MazE/SpoVT family DNA-binding domain-containing protein [Halogeometricum borinquense]
MASANPSTKGADGTRKTTPQSDVNSEIVLGEKVHDDIKTRQAQQNGNSENCIEVNLTKFGKQYHGIEKGQLLEVEVREGGILIKPCEFAER